MQLIRQFELMSEEKYKMEGKIRGFFHAYVGQEAIAAGCMTATKPEDMFITAYRDHGLAIAKGIPLIPVWPNFMVKPQVVLKARAEACTFLLKKKIFTAVMV